MALFLYFKHNLVILRALTIFPEESLKYMRYFANAQYDKVATRVYVNI